MKNRLLIVLIFAFCAYTSNAQTADEVINKYLENTGGISKWRALKAWTGKGKLTMQGMDFDFTTSNKAPNKQYLNISIQGQQIVQAYDGKDAWTVNPFVSGKDPVKMPPDDAKEMIEEEFEDEFIDYANKGHAVKYLGKEEVDGTQTYKIELIKNKNNDKEDVTQIYHFDVDTYVPILVISYVRSGPAKGQETRTFLGDYQDVEGGLVMPFMMESKMNGQTVQKMTFQKISLNPTIEDSYFGFPKK